MILLQSLLQPLNGNNLKSISLFLLIIGLYSCKSTQPVYKPQPVKQQRTIQAEEIRREKVQDGEKATQEKAAMQIESSKEPDNAVPSINDLAKEHNLALLLPFTQEKLEKKNTQESKDSIIAIDFYRGFEIGLNNYTGNIKLCANIYDTQQNSRRVIKIIKNSKRGNLIGPLLNEEVKIAAEYLDKEKSKRFLILPFTNNELELENYSNFIEIKPPPYIHALKLANFIIKQKSPKKIYYLKNEQESRENHEFISTFIYYVLNSSPNTLIQEITLKEEKDANTKLLGEIFTPSEENILFIPEANIDRWQSIMRSLNEISSNFQISILASPDLFKIYRKLDVVGLSRYQTYFSCANFIDIDEKLVLNFVKTYTKKYSVIPSKYSLAGYDLGNFLAHLYQSKNINQDYQGLVNNISLEFNGQSFINTSVKILNITTKGLKTIKYY